MNQALFNEYALIHGPEWRAKHKQQTMSVRGYCWYRLSYSLNTENNEVATCDACDSHFPVQQIALLPQCPRCRFGGDLGVFVTVPEFFFPYLRQVQI